jgi:hypothetical protein
MQQPEKSFSVANIAADNDAEMALARAIRLLVLNGRPRE